MVNSNAIQDILGTMKVSADFLTNLFYHRDSEKKLLVFYSFAYLSDKYIKMSEESMKKKADYEVIYFASKAEEIRQSTMDIFGEYPEKEYYRSMPFKIPRWYRGKTIPMQIMQFAEFCAENVQPDPEVIQDEKILYTTLREMFKSHRHTFEDLSGVGASVISVLRERYKRLIDKPPKLGGIYEMMLLMDVIEEVLKMLKNPQEMQEESDEIGEVQEKDINGEMISEEREEKEFRKEKENEEMERGTIDDEMINFSDVDEEYHPYAHEEREKLFDELEKKQIKKKKVKKKIKKAETK